MEASDQVEITAKGVEEIVRRAHRLSLRKRSVLLMLPSPKSVEELRQKTVLPQNEIDEALTSLAEEGFVTLSRPAPPLVEEKTEAPAAKKKPAAFGLDAS